MITFIYYVFYFQIYIKQGKQNEALHNLNPKYEPCIYVSNKSQTSNDMNDGKYLTDYFYNSAVLTSYITSSVS